MKVKRICSARAEVDCDLFTLNKKYYQTIVVNYPDIDKELKKIALERLRRI